MFKPKNILILLSAILAFGIPVSGASAHVGHHHKGEHHTDLTKGNPYMEALLHDPNVSLAASESGSSAKVVYLMEDHLVKGTKVHSPACHWGDGWNSGHTASGERFWFWDTHMYMCPNKNSSTGWVKVKGGMTGAECFNEVKPEGPAPGPTVEESEIRWVHNVGHFKARTHASERVKVHDWCGEAEASAWAYAMAYGRTKAQAQGNAEFQASGEAKVQAHARAVAILHCGEQKPPPQCVPGSPQCPEPPSKTPNCSEKPEQEKCKPVVTIETINDMEASSNGHEHTRYIHWNVEPGAESSLSTIETGLIVEYGTLKGPVEHLSGNEFRQLYKSPSEALLEEYHAWARDKNTHAFGESKTNTFPVKTEANFET